MVKTSGLLFEFILPVIPHSMRNYNWLLKYWQSSNSMLTFHTQRWRARRISWNDAVMWERFSLLAHTSTHSRTARVIGILLIENPKSRLKLIQITISPEYFWLRRFKSSWRLYIFPDGEFPEFLILTSNPLRLKGSARRSGPVNSRTTGIKSICPINQCTCWIIFPEPIELGGRL